MDSFLHISVQKAGMCSKQNVEAGSFEKPVHVFLCELQHKEATQPQPEQKNVALFPRKL